MLKTVKIKSGYIRGVPAADPRIMSFKGIPYGAPPVGKLRWRRPKPCEGWEGVRDCIEFAPVSMQSIPGMDKENIYTREWNVDSEIPMNEDSLYLNVWTPAASQEDKLPVYVWFHGGALQWGNASEMEFDGERIARRGIVVVTVNYRLNVFGFFAHPEMFLEDSQGDANIGNLDQQLALKWTRENIGAFGGNPDQITIGGQSAGGGSVVTQLNCQENKDLIKGAIIESGIFSEPFTKLFGITKDEAMSQGEEFLKYLGVSTVEEARALSAEYIRDKNDEFGKFWGTVIDGIYQKDTPYNNIRNKKFLDVPLMIGWTNNEFWAEDPDKGRFNAIERGSREFCRNEEESGYLSPRYVYEFGGEIPGEDDPGAFHSSDLWFFFETLAKCWRPFEGRHYDLARQMCNYWAYFIKTGNPNGMDGNHQRMETWHPFSSEDSEIMTFYHRPREKKIPEK